jgi:hypothetical protein
MSVDPTTEEAAETPAAKQDTAKKQDPVKKDDTGQQSQAQDGQGEAQNDPQNEGDADKPKRGRPRKQGGGARKTRSVELVLTVTGTMDGDWQADLKHGSERVVQGLQIPASAVSRAAKELHEDISDGIETVLGAAREQHRSRLEELEAEMQKVKAALAELEE